MSTAQICPHIVSCQYTNLRISKHLVLVRSQICRHEDEHSMHIHSDSNIDVTGYANVEGKAHLIVFLRFSNTYTSAGHLIMSRKENLIQKGNENDPMVVATLHNSRKSVTGESMCTMYYLTA